MFAFGLCGTTYAHAYAEYILTSLGTSFGLCSTTYAYAYAEYILTSLGTSFVAVRWLWVMFAFGFVSLLVGGYVCYWVCRDWDDS